MSWIAIEPSPTADATRFTDPCRTSPTAYTPGRLVSRRNGGGGRLRQVEFNLPQRRRLQDRRRTGAISPRDQQPAAGGGIDLAYPGKQLHAGPLRHPLVGQDQGHSARLSAEFPKSDEHVLRRPAGHDPIVRSVPRLQLVHQNGEAVRLVVHNDDDRLHNGLTLRRLEEGELRQRRHEDATRDRLHSGGLPRVRPWTTRM